MIHYVYFYIIYYYILTASEVEPTVTWCRLSHNWRRGCMGSTASWHCNYFSMFYNSSCFLGIWSCFVFNLHCLSVYFYLPLHYKGTVAKISYRTLGWTKTILMLSASEWVWIYLLLCLLGNYGNVFKAARNCNDQQSTAQKSVYS